jgi:hypothetical protein
MTTTLFLTRNGQLDTDREASFRELVGLNFKSRQERHAEEAINTRAVALRINVLDRSRDVLGLQLAEATLSAFDSLALTRPFAVASVISLDACGLAAATRRHQLTPINVMCLESTIRF